MASNNNGNGSVRVANRVRPYLDPMDEASMTRLVSNLTSERMEVLRRQTGGQGDPRRSINAECGFPEGAIGLDLYRNTYERNPIAKRVVEVLPHESWQTQPQVYEDEDPKVSTPFEHAWDDLGRSLRGGSLYQDEEGSPIWEYLHRVDVLSGIGHFGLILLGVDDGKDLQEPVEGSVTTNVRYANYETVMTEGERDQLLKQFPKEEKLISNMYRRDKSEQDQHAVRNAAEGIITNKVQTASGNDPFGPSPASQMGTDAQYFGWYGRTEFQAEKPSKEKRSLMFLRVFPEYLVQVVRYEANLRNARFGQPVMYRITLNDPRDTHSGVGLPIASIYVHWSRVVHVADSYQGGASSSEIFGVPRMRPVMNNLMSLEKLYGASGEAYWKACVNAMAFNTHPQLGGDVDINLEEMRNQVENYQNSLQRFLTGKGGKWESIAPTVTDPTPHITIHIEAICICIGCPIRIFKGSERGELASSQDDGAWNDRLKFRQYMYISPKIIVPFIDRLRMIGVLPQPERKADDVVANWRARGYEVRNAFGGYLVYPPVYNATTLPKSAWIGEWPKDWKIRNASKTAVPSENLPSKDGTRPTGPNPNASEISKPKPVAFVGGGGYSIEWKDLESNTALEKANIANIRTTALAAYVSGGIEALMPEHEYLTHIMEFDDEEAQQILDAAEKNMEESIADHGDLAKQGEEHDLVPTPPPGFEAKPEPPPPMPGMPGGPPTPPVKMGAGESLVHPETGKTVAKTPFPPKPTGTSKRGNVKNVVHPLSDPPPGHSVLVEDPELGVGLVETRNEDRWPVVFDQEEFGASVENSLGLAWDESAHPRDDGGKFSRGEATPDSLVPSKVVPTPEEKVAYMADELRKKYGEGVLKKVAEVKARTTDPAKRAGLERIEKKLNEKVPEPPPHGEPLPEFDLKAGRSEGRVAVGKIRDLSARFKDGIGGHAEMHAEVDSILSGLGKKELKEAAEMLGVRAAKGRQERVEGIKRSVSDRREMLRRTTKNEEAVAFTDWTLGDFE